MIKWFKEWFKNSNIGNKVKTKDIKIKTKGNRDNIINSNNNKIINNNIINNYTIKQIENQYDLTYKEHELLLNIYNKILKTIDNKTIKKWINEINIKSFKIINNHKNIEDYINYEIDDKIWKLFEKDFKNYCKNKKQKEIIFNIIQRYNNKNSFPKTQKWNEILELKIQKI